jgi:hypothetical protein
MDIGLLDDGGERLLAIPGGSRKPGKYEPLRKSWDPQFDRAGPRLPDIERGLASGLADINHRIAAAATGISDSALWRPGGRTAVHPIISIFSARAFFV